uniref:Uncharacterized protein n=1 Tax=viral metagenome TaxID=1070528 RepID=A0A6H1ZL61_9ZZZZ
MKAEISETDTLRIRHENEAERVFIERVLGLTEDGDKVDCVRVNAFNSETLIYLEVGDET